MKLSKRAKLTIGLCLGSLLIFFIGYYTEIHILRTLGINISFMAMGALLTTPEYFDN